MRLNRGGTGLRVLGQGRAYAAVIGVTVGMLVAGLAVPLAFGRTPSVNDSAQARVQLDPSFAAGSTPGANDHSGAPGGLGGTGTPLPSVAPTIGPARPARPVGPGASEGPTVVPTPSTRSTVAKLTATDQGVTATTIKLGVVLLDIQALQPLGFSQVHFTPREQQQQFQVFIDQVNKSGGLDGRKIVPDYQTWNPLDTSGSNSVGAVCSQLAETDKVFAAIGYLGGNGGNIGECLTEQFGVPAISNTGDIVEAYNKSHNLLITPYSSLERGAADWGDLSGRSGLLKGRKSGTVSSADPSETKPEQALVNALAADGQSVTYRAHLASDNGTAQSQMAVEINKMQAAGVDTVFLVTNFIYALQFVQTADRQAPNWKPLYMVSDLGSLTAEGLVANMPASFDGAYAFTQGNPASPEQAGDKTCRDTFNAATGNHYAAGQEAGGTTLECWMVEAFQAAADVVGADLTRTRLGAAFQSLGTPALPHTLPGSFRPGKTDWSDYLRPQRWSASCKCYQDAGAAQRGKY